MSDIDSGLGLHEACFCLIKLNFFIHILSEPASIFFAY